MGAWGSESCSSDACWDLMGGLEDIHNPQQQEVEPCLEGVMETAECSYYPRARFGVIIWMLDHGMTVPDKYLEWAEKKGNSLLDAYSANNDNGYLDDAVDCLKDEIAIVKRARMNAGRGEHRHINGLFENFAKGMAEGQAGLINKPG